MTLLFKCIKIIHHSTSKECTTILQRGLTNYYFSSFCLDAFHYTLDAALTEIV